MCYAIDWANLTSTEDDRAVAAAHVACSAVSAVCCIFVLLTSVRFRSLRKFPANMLLWKTACDLVTSLVVVGINAALLVVDAPLPVVGSSLCADGVLAGITGFCLLASPGWFVSLAYNLNRSLHDPFTRPQSRMGKYHLWVWSTSLAVGLASGSLH